MSNQRSIHGIVKGRVQGVFYRASVQTQAHALGLTGWVRNLPDGNVEFMAQGEIDAVQTLISWVKHGPRHAKVSAVEIQDIEPASDLQEFEIRY